MPHPLTLLLFIACSLPASIVAQPNSTESLIERDYLSSDVDNQNSATPQELNVISSTLAPEEIDRAVLDRLAQEIARDAARVAEELSASEEEIHNVSITLSNARNFINNNEMANIRAMCNAWNQSTRQGDARIQEALDAFKARRQFTLDFIQRFYRIVLMDVEASLGEQSRVRFNAYMDDRRRRMAQAGAAYSAAVVENVRSGAESVEFHCVRPRDTN